MIKQIPAILQALLPCLSFVLLSSLPLEAKEVELLFTDDFSAPISSEKWQGGEVRDGALVLSVLGEKKRFNGSRMLLIPPLKIPADEGHALHLRFTIVGFSEASDEEQDFSASARIFLMPEPLPKLVEPYSAPDVLSLIVWHDSTRGNNIALYRKSGEKGFGKPLYMGSLPVEEFPLVVDLFINRTQYRMLFDRDVLSDRGSLSGYHELPEGTWSGELRFGARIVNERDEVSSQVIFDDVQIGIADGLR